MTRNEFDALCTSLLIDPALALECNEVREALEDRDDDAVKQALEENF